MKTSTRKTTKLTAIAIVAFTAIVSANESPTTHDEFGFDVFGHDERGVHKSEYPGYDPLKDTEDVFSIHNMVVGAPGLDPQTKIGPATAFEIRIEILRLRAISAKPNNVNLLEAIRKTRAHRATLFPVPTKCSPPSLGRNGVDGKGRHKSDYADYDPVLDFVDRFSIYNYLISSRRVSTGTEIAEHSANQVLEVAIRLAGAAGSSPTNEEILKELRKGTGTVVKK